MKKEQIHGGDIYRNPGVTDFSVNGNPLGVQKEVLRLLRSSWEKLPITRILSARR